MAWTPRRKRRIRFLLAFLSPACFLYGLFVVYPILDAFRLSLYRWRGVSGVKRWAGLENFQQLQTDEVFRTAIGNNIWLLFVAGGGIFLLALAFAHAATVKGIIGRAFESVYLIPSIVSLALIAVMWRSIYHPTLGLIEGAGSAMGMDTLNLLGRQDTALRAVAVVVIWSSVGFYIMLLMAGIKGIPKEIYEAADLDGVRGLRRFVRITWPSIWSIRKLVIAHITISMLNVFAIVWLMTDGGPSRSTEVMLSFLYRSSFAEGRFGYGAAIAVVNFGIVMIASLLAIKLAGRDPTLPRRRLRGRAT